MGMAKKQLVFETGYMGAIKQFPTLFKKILERDPEIKIYVDCDDFSCMNKGVGKTLRRELKREEVPGKISE